MAKLSAAEKQKLYRQRRDADPVRRAEYLEKRRQGYVSDIVNKKRKNVGELSERERRAQRKAWRVNQARHRQRMRAVQTVLTPNSSPDRSPSIPRCVCLCMQREQGRAVRRNHSQRKRRKILKLENKIKQLTKQCNKYKRRCSRYTKQQQQAASPGSPSTRVRKFLQGQSVISPVKKTLTFHYALLDDLREKYKASRTGKAKRAIASIQAGRQIRRYKFQSLCQKSLSFSYKAGKELRSKCEDASGKRALVRQFYLRDDVSRLTTGKKNTITIQKVKKQRRLLCDFLQNLHIKFVAEHGDVSYTFFCRHRPFLVVKPNAQDRETCQCKTHENLQFMADTLYKHGLLDSKNVDQMADATVCNAISPHDAKVCAYGDCMACKSKAYPFTKPPSKNEVTLTQWCLVKTDSKQEQEKHNTITVKRDVTETEDEIATQFQERLFHFRRHLYNIRWQYKAYRHLRETLTPKDCLIHIDFSENFTCKYATEIQSVHFGGSHQQATLHTGVLYVHDQPPMSFATISPSRRHDPVAIWAHLDPILDMVQSEYSDVQHLHFFSDGPATQYRQKGNFFMISSEPHQKGFKKITWNFFEASHGKGAPDGVGGALKRSADALICHGRDIPDARALYQVLMESGTQVKLFYVSNEDVEERSRKMQEVALSAIKGTMKIHQVLSLTPGVLKYRDVSCFCQAGENVWDCPCYGLQNIVIGAVPPTQKDQTEPQTQRPDVIESHHCGQWCIVNYDGQPYPGIILTVEEQNVQIKCMHRTGRYDLNRFYWPSPIEDLNWYAENQIMCLMPEPVAANKRYIELDDKIWAFLKAELGC
ncbi:hypothetical protein ACEWY4_005947 [Coilia grayii]|uniref:Uncharacterized protein n=1 Tax=Coilia grayii TaxID=363190 RepID=A0ABD1KK51_9TELE